MYLIVDIDHTISDATWRNHMIDEALRTLPAKGTDAWDEYHAQSIHDKPVGPVIQMVRDLYASEWVTIALTARPEKWRAVTNDWLVSKSVPFHMLLMRNDEDYRPTAEVKLDALDCWLKDKCALHEVDPPAGGLLEADQTVIVLDDREDVAALFKSRGFTVLQVHIGRHEHDGPVHPDNSY